MPHGYSAFFKLPEDLEFYSYELNSFIYTVEGGNAYCFRTRWANSYVSPEHVRGVMKRIPDLAVILLGGA